MREKLRRRARLGLAARRAAMGVAAVAALALAFNLLLRASGARPIPESATRAASAAECGDVQTPESDPTASHLSPGEVFRYTNEPATAGPHDPSPLPPEPHVYTSPVPETNAVHNLEHAYVFVYYRAEGTDALPAPVVERLASFTGGQDKVIMAPHLDLPESTSLALVAWNKLWECPASLTPQQASTIASGFVEAYRGTANAPEPGAP